jgi:tetratricopeptide (TPR) repeat protein
MNSYRFLTILMVFSSLVFWGCSPQSPVKKEPTAKIIISPSPSPIISPSDIKAANRYRQLGLQYRQQGDFVKSIEALKKSVQLNPNHLDSRVILGWTQHLAKQPLAAQKTLEATIKIAPNHVPAYNALGIVYLVAGNLQQAVKTHSKAAELKPDNEIAYYNLSLAYHRLKDFDSAIANAQKAVKLEPNNPHPLVALAMIYLDQGDPKKAQDTYRQAISLDGRYRQKWFLGHLSEAGFSQEQIKLVEKLQLPDKL